jgi:hypothetical protein
VDPLQASCRAIPFWRQKAPGESPPAGQDFPNWWRFDLVEPDEVAKGLIKGLRDGRGCTDPRGFRWRTGYFPTDPRGVNHTSHLTKSGSSQRLGEQPHLT